MLLGVRFDPKDPLRLSFIIDNGSDKAVTKTDIEKLVRYFFAGLTTPDKDLWVNLSPYEQDFIIPQSLGGTDLGRDLLGQDYLLKQLLSSLTYPEDAIGKNYWEKTYSRIAKDLGTDRVAVGSFNKVWIVPDTAKVYDGDNSAVILDASLKTMIDSDHLANSKNSKIQGLSQADLVAAKVLKEDILPRSQEISSGRNFLSCARSTARLC